MSDVVFSPCRIQAPKPRKSRYSQTKIPLGELIRRVAEDTGVELTATPDVADEPVALHVEGIAARELLEQLADLLDYQWSRRTPRRSPATRMGGQSGGYRCAGPNAEFGSGGAWRYEIWQDLASKRREAALREALLAHVERRFEEEVQRLVAMAELPAERIRLLVEANEQRWAELQQLAPREREAFLTSAEGQEWMRRRHAALQLSSPIPRALTTLLRDLTGEQWARLRADQPITFSTAPQRGELRLSMNIARILRASRPTTFPPGLSLSDVPLSVQERIGRQDRAMQEEWAAATGFRVTVRLHTRRFQTRGSLFLEVTPTPIRAGRPNPPAVFAEGMGTNLGISVLSDEIAQQAVIDTRVEQSGVDHDALLSTKRLFHPRAIPRSQGLGAKTGAAGRRFPDLMSELAETYQVQFISDAYWGGFRVVPQPSDTESIALLTLLERYVRQSHRWDRQRNLIRLRSRTWYLDRPREIPLRLAQHWSELFHRHGALPIDEYVAMVSALTETQLHSFAGIIEETGLPQDFLFARAAWPTLRFYASLSPAQREVLEQGGPLQIASLAPMQLGLFLTCMKELTGFGSTPANVAHWVAGNVSLEVTPDVRTVHGHGTVLAYPTVASTPPPAGPGWPVPGGPRADSNQARAGPGNQPDVRGVSEFPASDAAVRHPVRRVRLRFESGGARQLLFSLTVAAPSHQK